MEINENDILCSYVSLFNEDLLPLLSENEKKLILFHLTHQEEREVSHRDQWGNWDFPFTKFDYSRPYLDLFIKDKMASFGLAQKRIWPEERKFAICITHDLDHIGLNRLQISQRARTRRSTQLIHHLLSQAFNLTAKLTGDSLLWCYERWLNYLQEIGYRSTFFIYSNPRLLNRRHEHDNLYELNDIVKFDSRRMTVAEMIREMSRRGFEIGLHGSYYSAIDSALFNEQKLDLEEALGQKITVTRQHFLHYNILKTPGIHSSNGVLVDSTMGFNRTVGFRAGTCMPYVIGSNQGVSLLEVPMLIMDGALFTANALELNEELAIYKSLQIMDYCEKMGGILTINFHPNYIVFEKWWNVFKAIVNEAKNRNAYNTSLQDIYDIVSKNVLKSKN